VRIYRSLVGARRGGREGGNVLEVEKPLLWFRDWNAVILISRRSKTRSYISN
jgi:hypothetical protein